MAGKETKCWTDIADRYNTFSEQEKRDISVAAGAGVQAYKDGKEEGMLRGTILGAIVTGAGVLMSVIYAKHKEAINTKVKGTTTKAASAVKRFFKKENEEVIDGEELIDEVSEE